MTERELLMTTPTGLELRLMTMLTALTHVSPTKTLRMDRSVNQDPLSMPIAMFSLPCIFGFPSSARGVSRTPGAHKTIKVRGDGKKICIGYSWMV